MFWESNVLFRESSMLLCKTSVYENKNKTNPSHDGVGHTTFYDTLTAVKYNV